MGLPLQHLLRFSPAHVSQPNHIIPAGPTSAGRSCLLGRRCRSCRAPASTSSTRPASLPGWRRTTAAPHAGETRPCSCRCCRLLLPAAAGATLFSFTWQHAVAISLSLLVAFRRSAGTSCPQMTSGTSGPRSGSGRRRRSGAGRPTRCRTTTSCTSSQLSDTTVSILTSCTSSQLSETVLCQNGTAG